MKFLLWGTVAIVSQSWRQSALGLLVIRMPHDDKCLKGEHQNRRHVKAVPEGQRSTNGAGEMEALLLLCWSVLNSAGREKDEPGAIKPPIHTTGCWKCSFPENVFIFALLQIIVFDFQ